MKNKLALLSLVVLCCSIVGATNVVYDYNVTQTLMAARSFDAYDSNCTGWSYATKGDRPSETLNPCSMATLGDDRTTNKYLDFADGQYIPACYTYSPSLGKQPGIQRFIAKVDYNPASLSRIEWKWRGNEDFDGDLDFFVWNWTRGNWSWCGKKSGWTDANITTCSFTGSIASYINTTTNYTYFLAWGYYYLQSINEAYYTDYVSFTATYTTTSTKRVSDSLKANANTSAVVTKSRNRNSTLTTNDAVSTRYTSINTIRESFSCSDNAQRSVVFSSMNISYSILPSNTVSFDASGFNVTVVWNITSGGGIDSKNANITSSDGTLIGSYNTSPIILYNLSIDSYTMTLWGKNTYGNTSFLLVPFSVVDTTDPSYISTTFSSSPYYLNYVLYIYINASDEESGVDDVLVDIRDPNGVLYTGLHASLSGGRWIKSYTPSVVGVWNITQIEVIDDAANSITVNPQKSFSVTSVPTTTVEGGATARPVTMVVTTGLAQGNITFGITPSELRDVITRKGENFSVDVTVFSTSSNYGEVALKIFDPCTLFKEYRVYNDNGTYSVGSEVISLKSFAKTKTTYYFSVPEEYSKDYCNVLLSFMADGNEKKLNIRVWTTPFMNIIRRTLTLFYYPIVFDEDAKQITFLGENELAVFPSTGDFTIPFAGTALMIWLFFTIRYSLLLGVKDFRRKENNKWLLLFTCTLFLGLMILISVPFSFTIELASKGIGFMIVTLFIFLTVLLFKLPKLK